MHRTKLNTFLRMVVEYGPRTTLKEKKKKKQVLIGGKIGVKYLPIINIALNPFLAKVCPHVNQSVKSAGVIFVKGTNIRN